MSVNPLLPIAGTNLTSILPPAAGTSSLASALNSSSPSLSPGCLLTLSTVPNLSNGGRRDGWLRLEVCREFLRKKCSRTAEDCKYAHPPQHVDQEDGYVVCCYDSLKGNCKRTQPPCKFLHPPDHLKSQLLERGKQNLQVKNSTSGRQLNLIQSPYSLFHQMPQFFPFQSIPYLSTAPTSSTSLFSQAAFNPQLLLSQQPNVYNFFSQQQQQLAAALASAAAMAATTTSSNTTNQTIPMKTNHLSYSSLQATDALASLGKTEFGDCLGCDNSSTSTSSSSSRPSHSLIHTTESSDTASPNNITMSLSSNQQTMNGLPALGLTNSGYLALAKRAALTTNGVNTSGNDSSTSIQMAANLLGAASQGHPSQLGATQPQQSQQLVQQVHNFTLSQPHGPTPSGLYVVNTPQTHQAAAQLLATQHHQQQQQQLTAAAAAMAMYNPFTGTITGPNHSQMPF